VAKADKIKRFVAILTGLAIAVTIIAIAIAFRSGASPPFTVLLVTWLPIILMWSGLKKLKL
jgi:hypothetical protein